MSVSPVLLPAELTSVCTKGKNEGLKSMLDLDSTEFFTERGVKVIKHLVEFCSLKSLLHRSRRDPALLNDPAAIQKMLDYVLKHSTLGDTPFWKGLTEQQRGRFAQLFVLQEVETRHIERLNYDSMDSAALYICLTGSAEVVPDGFSLNDTKEQKSDDVNSPSTTGRGILNTKRNPVVVKKTPSRVRPTPLHIGEGTNEDDDSLYPFSPSTDGIPTPDPKSPPPGSTRFMTPHRRVFHGGEIFGAVDLFNDYVTDGDKFYQRQEERETEARLLPAGISKRGGVQFSTVTMEQGTYLRLSFSDLRKYVLNRDIDLNIRYSVGGVALTPALYADISGIPYDQMTDADKFYVEVYLRVRHSIHCDLFAFLNAFKLVPMNASMPSYVFYHEARFQAKLNLQPKDALAVYIIVNGSARVEIIAGNGSAVLENGGKKLTEKQQELQSITEQMQATYGGSVSANKKVNKRHILTAIGDSEFGLQTHSLPLLSLSNGGTFFFNEDCFNVGSSAPLQPLDDATEALAQTFKNQMAISRKLPSSSGAATHNPHSATTNLPLSPKTIQTKLHAPYHLRVVFEQPTSYLKIPHEYFVRYLSDDRYVSRTMSASILHMLTRSSTGMIERIARLLPWVRGELGLAPPVETDSWSREVIETAPPTLLHSLGGIPKEATTGSFMREIVHRDDDSSIATDSIPSPEDDIDTVQSVTSWGGQVNPASPYTDSSQHDSRLRRLMDDLRLQSAIHDLDTTPASSNLHVEMPFVTSMKPSLVGIADSSTVRVVNDKSLFSLGENHSTQ